MPRYPATTAPRVRDTSPLSFLYPRDGTTWYALVHGLYPSIEEARLAIERMPESAQRNQPWIRAIGRIQNALKEQ